MAKYNNVKRENNESNENAPNKEIFREIIPKIEIKRKASKKLEKY